MKNKLFVNANHFDMKEIKIIYISNRIENLAAKNFNLRTREKFLSSFLSSENMLVILKGVFNDFKKKLTTINEFDALRIKNKNFHIY